MKTKELIKAFEEISNEYRGEISLGNAIIAFLRRDEPIATVKIKEVGKFTTMYPMFNMLDINNQKKIVELLTEYAFTPLDEREEEKKYYIVIEHIAYTCSFLNFNIKKLHCTFGDKSENSIYKTQFTKTEIKKYGLEKFTDNPLFELIEVKDNE